MTTPSRGPTTVATRQVAHVDRDGFDVGPIGVVAAAIASFFGAAHCRRNGSRSGFPVHHVLSGGDLHQVNTDRKASFNWRSW